MRGERPPQLDTIEEKDTKKGRKGGEQKINSEGEAHCSEEEGEEEGCHQAP